MVSTEKVWILADSGTSKSLVSETFAAGVELDIKPVATGIVFKSAGDHTLEVLAEAKMSLGFKNFVNLNMSFRV